MSSVVIVSNKKCVSNVQKKCNRKCFNTYLATKINGISIFDKYQQILLLSQQPIPENIQDIHSEAITHHNG